MIDAQSSAMAARISMKNPTAFGTMPVTSVSGKLQIPSTNIQRSSKAPTSNFASLVLEHSLVLGAWNLDVAVLPWLKIRKVMQGFYDEKKSPIFFRHFDGESLENQAKTIKKTLQNHAKNTRILTCFCRAAKSSCRFGFSAANYGMAGTGYKLDSLRPRRMEGERVLLALAISIFAHVLIWGGYELNRDLHWTRHLPWFTPKPLPLRIVQVEQPLEFVTVDNPSKEAPQNTQYFSTHNSMAANPDANKITGQPKINGKQTDVPATEDIRLHQLSKSTTGEGQQQQDNSQAQQALNPKPEVSAGDLTLGKPNTQEEQPRPRTLKQAYEAMKNRMPQMAMNEDGGASRHAREAAFDVKVTGYADYDERFANTVNQNWWNLLDSRQFALDRTGKVVLLFRLNYDGSISQMRVAQTTVGDLLAYVCEKAVLEGAPYEPWTENMRLQIGDNIDVEYIFEY